MDDRNAIELEEHDRAYKSVESEFECSDSQCAASVAPESIDFDFDKYYGSTASDDTDSLRSARPDSCIRPYSCGLAISEGDNPSTKTIGNAGIVLLPRSTSPDSSDGESVTSNQQDPFEDDTFVHTKQEDESSSFTTRVKSGNEDAISMISCNERQAQSRDRTVVVPQIFIDECDDGRTPNMAHFPSVKDADRKHCPRVVPRSSVVSFAAEESIITFESTAYEEETCATTQDANDHDIHLRANTQTPRLSRSFLSPQSVSISRQSMAALPTWASVYYKRGSACLSQLARRSTIKWGAGPYATDDSETLIDQNAASEMTSNSASTTRIASVNGDRAIIRPATSHNSRVFRKSTMRCSSRISELSWKPELKHAIEVPVKTHFEHASFARAKTSEEDAKLLRKVILLFSLGFLFPPLWFWGCFSSTTKRNPLALPCDDDLQYPTRRINQWRVACAVMLGVTVLMITICAIVALTMKDLR